MSKQTTLSPQEQQKLLDNSIAVIKSEIYQMRKCLESKNKLMDALKHASNFLNELRTSSLNPKQYYELYILIHDGLNYLIAYLKDNKTSTNKNNNNYLIDLYELIQYAGNIIPRLYLMITIGTIYMGVEDAPVLEVLNDMLEMCKGVQNPIRGLFLRYYLIQKTKKYLIDMNNDSSSANDNNIENTINFIISNFIEMNKLWVRLQYQGHSSERQKRIEERNELKILVGSNLVILSQLDSINKDIYKERILPEILQQIIKCKDSIAQNYLLDVIIQIFPDNFQIASLKTFLNSLLLVNEDVDVTVLLNSLIDRLIHYKLRNNEILTDNTFLKEFITFILNLNKNSPNFPIESYCTILNGILKLSLTFNDDNDILDLIFKLSIDKFELMKGNDKDTEKFKIILESIENFTSFDRFFQINDDNYFKLFQLQSLHVKKEICCIIISKILENEITISKEESLEMLFKYIDESILFKEDIKISETKADLFGDVEANVKRLSIGDDDKKKKKENLMISRMINYVSNEDNEQQSKLLSIVEKHILEGNEVSHTHIIPTLVRKYMMLVIQMNEEEDRKVKEMSKIFNKMSKLIEIIKEVVPNKALNLNLDCALISNECKLNDITYEFFIETFIIYEELIVESKAQYQSLMNIVNTLMSVDEMIVQNAEDFDKLILKATLYGSRLMKKSDQCRAIYNSSHLWWINKESEPEEGENEDEEEETVPISLKRDDKRVLECLQKSLRIADSITDRTLATQLFIEILNESVYYFIHGIESVSVRYLNGLVELIGNSFKEQGGGESMPGPWGYYERTLKYIKAQRPVDSRFFDISV